MCIAIVATKGSIVDDKKLESCHYINDDGGGMAYLDKEGKVVIDKGYMDIAAFKARYKWLIKEGAAERGPMLLHFRIGTSGANNSANTHPFKVKGGAMIHNGVFWSSGFNNMSDTRVLAGMLHNRLTKDAVTKYKLKLEEVAGYNKVAFLYEGGDYIILNEDSGHWDGGVWYSNTSYKALEGAV